MAITIATFERGGTFHLQGIAIASVAARLGSLATFGEIRILETPTASLGNAERLAAGEADFGFVAANLIGRAMRGEAPFARPIALRTVAPANVGPVFFVASAHSDLRTIDDLRGQRVAVGPPANAMRSNVAAIMAALGHSIEDFEPLALGFEEGARALIEGRADAQVQPPVPNRVIDALAEAIDLRVLDYGPGQLAQVLGALPLFRRVVMRPGAIRGLKTESAQPGVFNLLATHARVPDDKVSAMAQLMAEHARTLGQITPLFEGLAELFAPLGREGATALEIDGVGLHPGALAAYRRLGLIAA